jgi:predicted dehydrogenase
VLAGSYGVPYFANHEDMLENGGIAGAVVALPNALHVPVATDLVAHDVAVLVEKPVADTLDSAYLLVEASRDASVPVLVGHQRRHSPDIARARSCIVSGRLGRVVAVSGTCLMRKNDDYFDAGWRREPGGDPILINLIHDIDALRFLLGEIVTVGALSSNQVRGLEVEDSAAVILNFASGAVGTLVLSDAVPAPWCWDLNSGKGPFFPYTPADCYLICGTEASLAVPTMELWEHPAGNPYENQLRHFVDVVEGRAEPLIDAADGMRTLAATLAVARSAETRELVRVDDLVPAQ